jgi:hypothetical protein
VKRVKRALLFCLFGLLVVIIFSLVLDSNLQGAQESEHIKENKPNTYNVNSYVDLFILDGSPHCKYLFVDAVVNGKLAYIDEDTHTIILQDLNDESRYLRAIVPKEKWTKVKFFSKGQKVYINAYAIKLTYFNEPIVEVREIGKI